MTEQLPALRPSSSEQLEEIAGRTNLSRAQFLIWMGQRLFPDSPLYNMVLRFTIEGALDEEAFRRAFTTLVAGSDAMRTVVEAGWWRHRRSIWSWSTSRETPIRSARSRPGSRRARCDGWIPQ